MQRDVAGSRPTIAAADFFTIGVWAARGLVTHYALFAIDLATRAVSIAGVTTNPDSDFMAQVARNLTDQVNGLLRRTANGCILQSASGPRQQGAHCGHFRATEGRRGGCRRTTWWAAAQLPARGMTARIVTRARKTAANPATGLSMRREPGERHRPSATSNWPFRGQIASAHFSDRTVAIGKASRSAATGEPTIARDPWHSTRLFDADELLDNTHAHGH